MTDGLNISIVMDIYALLGVPPTGFQSTPFVNSWCLPTYALATIRIFLSVYCFTTIVFSFKWFATHTVIFHLQDIDTKAITFPVGAEGIRQSFSYFTYLSYWGLAFYFFFASLHTFVYARRRFSWLDTWPRCLQAMYSTYYSTIVCFPLLVSTVYWCSMWTRTWWADDFDQWSMISMHAMNSAFAAFEIVATQTRPLPWAHLITLLLIMSFYLGVAYITKSTEGIYVYLWLDPKLGLVKIILHIIGYAGVMIVYFILVRLFIILRCRWTKQPSDSSFRVIGSKRASYRSSDTFWTYERYDMEMERKQGEKELEVNVIALTEPELAHHSEPRLSCYSQFTTIRPSMDFPRRKSSYDVRNYIRPDSIASVSTMPKHSGFWV